MTAGTDILGKYKPELHEACGKKHSKPELVEKCEARLEAKAMDAERRELNQVLQPVEVLIDVRLHEGRRWDQIVAELKKDYPPPEGEHARYGGADWDLVKVVDIDSKRQLW